MNVLQVTKSVRDELLRWQQDFAAEPYRRRRAGKWAKDAIRDPIPAKSPLDVRYLEDRRFPVGMGLEAWFMDMWAFQSGQDQPSHSLMVLVCQEGLDKPPLAPRPSYIRHVLRDPVTEGMTLVLPGYANDGERLHAQWMIVDSLDRIHPRRAGSSRPRRYSTSVRLTKRTSPDELLAQLLLPPLRAGQLDTEAYDWLVSFAKSAASVDTQAYAADAVNHALLNFVLPVGTLRRYLRRVASGMATEGQPPTDVIREAERLDVSWRSVYRWRRDSADFEGKATHLKYKRTRAGLARLVAAKQAIDPSAARMRINRRLQKGIPLQEIAAELLNL